MAPKWRFSLSCMGRKKRTYRIGVCLSLKDHPPKPQDKFWPVDFTSDDLLLVYLTPHNGSSEGWFRSLGHESEAGRIRFRRARFDLLMGLFREGARKQPSEQTTEMPTSTLALMGRFPDFVRRGGFTSWKTTGKQPIKKRGMKRFLISNTELSESFLPSPSSGRELSEFLSA